MIDRQREQYISLREIGRRLNIPPSSVVYYKDKFSKFIPSSGGQGRRQRYPHEALDVFRRIREMFEKNWSAEQIEQNLSLKIGGILKNGQPDQRLIGAGAVTSEVAGVLGRMADALQDQAMLRNELRSLLDEVAGMRRDRRESEERMLERLGGLEREVELLRKENARLAGRSRGGAGTMGDFPSEAFLVRPLVIRSEHGEYLGVPGGGDKHFALKDFIALIERRMSANKFVDMRWERRNGNWVLLLDARDEVSGDERNIVLVVTKTLTPSNNLVTHILRMNIDGKDVPDALLLSLFKQIKDNFTD